MWAEAKKHEYWNHFIAKWALEKLGGGYGPTGGKVTATRLHKVKLIVFREEFFWQDILLRHDGMNMTPEQMIFNYPHTYDHCSGNFWGMLIQIMIENNILP